MPTILQTRTAAYPENARRRLAKAITYARLAAGFNSRAELAQAANLSTRSISALETGEPTVGHRTLTNVGRTLGHYIQDWSEDTPLRILQGHPAPPNELRTPAPDTQLLQPLRVADTRDLLRMSINLLHRQGMTKSDGRKLIFNVLDECYNE